MRVAGVWVSVGVFGVGARLVGRAGCSAVGVGMAVGEGSVPGTSGVLGGGGGVAGVVGRDTLGVGIVGAGVLLRGSRPSIRPTARATSSAPRSGTPFCESPPIGTVKSWKPHSGESRSIHLGYAAGHWFTVYDCSANYECDRHEEEAAARDYVGVLITTFGRDTSWMEFEPE